MANYRIMFLITGMKKPVVENRVAGDLPDLLLSLRKQGVSTSTTDYMYVHKELPGGKVAEIMAFESTKKENNVVDIQEARKKKPRVTPPAATNVSTLIHDLLYTASPAKAWNIVRKKNA